MLLDNGFYVYAINNPAIPGMVKIGVTTNIENRLYVLSKTSVPTPFELITYKEFKNRKEMFDFEKRIHDRLSDVRVSMNREFFYLSKNDVIKLFKNINSVYSYENKLVYDVVSGVDLHVGTAQFKRYEFEQLRNTVKELQDRSERYFNSYIKTYKTLNDYTSNHIDYMNNTNTQLVEYDKTIEKLKHENKLLKKELNNKKIELDNKKNIFKKFIDIFW